MLNGFCNCAKLPTLALLFSVQSVNLAPIFSLLIKIFSSGTRRNFRIYYLKIHDVIFSNNHEYNVFPKVLSVKEIRKN